MTAGLIETICLYEVVEALDASKPEDCHLWSWTSAVEATCALIGSRHLQLAPSPTQDGAASGPLGLILSRLANDVVGVAVPPPGDVRASKSTVKRWAKAHPDLLRNVYADLKRSKEYDAWLDWFSRNVWIEHANRLGGLFDPSFIPELSAVVGLSEDDLRTLWQRSADQRELERIARAGVGDSLFEELSSAYTVSALIRGRYHDAVARRSGWQIMQHPLRSGVLTARQVGGAEEFEVSSTLWYLSNIVLSGCFAERRARRLETWLANVSVARQAALAEELDLRPKRNDDLAEELAVNSARRLAIRVHPAMLDRALDAAAGLGVGTFSSFALHGWEALLAVAGSVGTATFAKSLGDPSQRIVSAVSKRRRRLEQMARAGPGRIVRIWVRK